MPAVTQPGNPESTATSDILAYLSGSGANSGSSARFWGTAEYLLWWTKGSSLPPLVTTGPALPVTPPPGAIGTPGTTVLFGGNDGDRNPLSGGLFTVGFWMNDSQTIGFEGSFFFLGQGTENFNAATSGAPGSIVLARPFFDTSTGMENSELIGYPGLAAGSVHIQSTLGLLGASGNLLYNLCRSCDTCFDSCCGPTRSYRVDLLAGFCFMQLREGLTIDEDTQVNATSPVFAGDNISAFDQFNTLNTFYGAQLGIRSQYWWKRVFVMGTAMVALGDTHQSVDINGATTITAPGGPATVLPGNLLALPSNIGHYSRDQFSVIPQVGFNVGYQVTRNLGVFAGYNFLYWSNVERPGDAINTNVNSTRVPTSTVAPTGPLDPLFSFHNSGFWAQGVSAGLQLRF